MAEKQEVASQPEAAGDELARLKQKKAALARELESGSVTIARLEAAAASRDGEVAGLHQALADSEGKLKEAGSALAQAVASYKELVVQSNPGLLAELIAGDTVDAVNESLENAKALISRVRQEIEGEASRSRVPAGAPQRTPPDLSVLSAREKIQYAIGGNR